MITVDLLRYVVIDSSRIIKKVIKELSSIIHFLHIFSSLPYREKLSVNTYCKLGGECSVSPFYKDQWVESQQYQCFFNSKKPLYLVVTKIVNE